MKIHIGQNALSGRAINLPLKAFMDTHSFVLGRTRMGKSYLLEMVARAIIRAGYGLIFLDGKGDLFDSLQKFLASNSLETKTVLVDPTEKKWSVGINYLELFGDTSEDALSELVLEGLMKFFKEDKEYKPWLEEWGPASILPLIKGRFTLLELFPFTLLQDASFRETLLSKLDHTFYQQKWRELRSFKPQEQATILNVLKTRASKFWTSEPLKYIFGQSKTTIDWLRLMNKGGILLANLGRGPNLPEKTASFIGASILHQLIVNAPLRPKGQRRPVFLIVDEFQKFACNDFADALDKLAGYGIYLILSCQHLAQLAEENQRLHDSVMSNCGNKFSFSINRKDAEEMARELFTGWIHQPRIKDEIWQTKLMPIESTREVVSSGQARGGFSSSLSGSSSTIMNPEGSLFISPPAHSATSMESRGTSSARSTTRTTTEVPWYEYEAYEEVTSRTYHTPEEIVERYIAWVVKQDPRHLQMKIGNKKPIPVITADLKETPVLPSWLSLFRESVFSKCALPVPEIEKEIEGRVKSYLSVTTGSDKNPLPSKINFRQKRKAQKP